MSALVACLTLLLVLQEGGAPPPDAPAPGVARESAAPEDANGGLDAIVEMLDLRAAPLEDALRMLSEESGVNLIASETAARKPISAFLQALSVRDAIQAIALSNGLWFRVDEGAHIVRVMSNEEFQRDLKEFRDQRTEVFTLLFPNAFDIAVALRNLFGNRVHLSLDRDLLFDQYEELNQRLRRFDLIDSRTQGQEVNGFNGFNALNNSQGTFLNQTNRAYEAPQPEALEGERESESLGATQIRQLEELARSGADTARLAHGLASTETTIFVTVLRRTNTLVVRSADGAAMDEIEELVQSLDVPTPQVLLEVKILNLDLGDDFSSVFDFAFEGGSSSGSFTTGLLPSGGITDPSALLFRFVDEHFRARVQLLEQDDRVTTLATPMLLVANNEVARLFVGEERPLVRSVSSQTFVAENGVTTSVPVSTTELREVGTTLLLTPNVNADRTVTLRILQETSEVRLGAATIPIVLDGSVVQQPVDTVASRNLTGTVVAKDGLTLAVGGLIEEQVGTRRSGVPWLMDLPLVGALFRREQKTRSHRELVLLIRPYVLFTSAEGHAISRQLADELVLHPAGFEAHALGTFEGDEVPRAPLGKHALREALQFQSGLPDGR